MWGARTQRGFYPGYKQISGITSFDNQARNDKNNKIIRVIYSFHLVISSFLCIVYFCIRPDGVFSALHFFLCYSASRAQPQITLIILSPFFRCTRHLSLWQIRRLSRAVQLARWCSKFGEKTVFNLEIKLQANEKKKFIQGIRFFLWTKGLTG